MTDRAFLIQKLQERVRHRTSGLSGDLSLLEEALRMLEESPDQTERPLSSSSMRIGQKLKILSVEVSRQGEDWFSWKIAVAKPDDATPPEPVEGSGQRWAFFATLRAAMERVENLLKEVS